MSFGESIGGLSRAYKPLSWICRLSLQLRFKHGAAMRFLPSAVVFLALMLLAACSNDPAEPVLAAGLFAGEGRDALCIAGTGAEQRAGFIAYGIGEENCSARGRIEHEGGKWALVPSGENECRFPLEVSEGRISLGQGPASCSYYCGPGAAFAGKSFRRVDPGDATAAGRNPMTDLAGDPLC
jgi:hypothetical protein